MGEINFNIPTSNDLKLKNNIRLSAWRWVKKINWSDISVWKLEWIKCSIMIAERNLKPLPLPEEHSNKSVASSLFVVLAISLGFLFGVLYALRYKLGAKQVDLPDDVNRLGAVHAEWSTRTRHLLTAINESDSKIGAIILLGRLRYTPTEVSKLWSEKNIGPKTTDLPLIIPMSPRSCLSAIIDLPNFLREGLNSSSQVPSIIPFKELVAISFRVFLGAVASRWWEEKNVEVSHEVLFGITGTADTTLFELAIQKSGGRTAHVLHGQTTGPNFVGISNLALFRSQYDADMYSSVGCYGCCKVQRAMKSTVHRSSNGLMLLTNLAHPMNPYFSRMPLEYEIFLLKCVGFVARNKIGASAYPLLWKPHPIVYQLPNEMQRKLSHVAKKEGFIELPEFAPTSKHALDCRWIISSPSTVALDLLQEGYLCILLDPESSVLDTALSVFPKVNFDPLSLEFIINQFNEKKKYDTEYENVFSNVGPAKKISINGIF